MNLAPSVIMNLGRADSVLKLVLATFLVYWICMLPALFGNATAGTAATRLLTLPAMLTMYCIASSKMTQLARAFAVLGQLQAPHALRRELVRETLRYITLAWAFLAAGVALQFALPQSHVSMISGAALVSVAACLGMLRSLSYTPLKYVAFSRLLDATPYLALIALASFDLNALLERFNALPFIVLCLITGMFWGVRDRIDRTWKYRLPLYRWSAPKPAQGIGAWFARQARRTTMLNWHGNAGAALPRAASIAVSLLPLLFLAGDSGWVEGHMRVMKLTVVCLVAAGCLVARDLHWRAFLMPGGMRRGSIATHILASTLIIQFSFTLVLSLLYIVLAHYGFYRPWDAIASTLARSAALPVELIFVTSVALVLRAGTSFSRLWAVVLGVAALSALTALLRGATWMPALWAMSYYVYVLVLLLSSAVLMYQANRVWTPDLLFAAARRAG